MQEIKQSAYLFMALLGLMLMACSGDKDQPKPQPPQPNESDQPASAYYHGVDLSYVNQVEDNGGVYRDEKGTVIDPYIFLQQKGANLARIRLWHTPENTRGNHYSGLSDVEKSIRRAKFSGMEVLLDFHYSDTWADPGHQDLPKAWEAITNIEVLCDSIYTYTYSTLLHLYEKGLLPELVQIGNETNCGMLRTNLPEGFPNLDVCKGHWSNFGKAVNAGIQAVRDIDGLAGRPTKIILHVADPKNLDHWTRDIMAKGSVSDFDIMGVSYYHIWHSTISFDALPDLLKSLRQTHQKDFMVLETAYPFTSANNDSYNNIYFDQEPVKDFDYTVEGQKQFMTALNQNMKEAGVLGVIYWEPAWISSTMNDGWGTGSSWENVAFFDFQGRATSVLDYLSHPY